MSLDEQWDVDSDSSAEEGDGTLDAMPQDGDTSPEPAADAPKGRTVDNVYGEFSRKFSQLERDLAKITGALETMTTMKPDTPVTQPQSPQEMSSAQLRAMRPNVPEENLSEFEALVQKAEFREMLDARLEEHNKALEVSTTRSAANAEAKQRYPELNDRTSDFYTKVDMRLQELGPGYAHGNPRAVLDIANEIALREGKAPSISRAPAGRLAKSNTAPRSDAKAPKADLPISRDDAARIAHRMQHAMPNGEFNLDRIMEKMQTVQDNIQLFGGK